eukprot:365928-Chlamydomonas_euryale.AAC.12
MHGNATQCQASRDPAFAGALPLRTTHLQGRHQRPRLLCGLRHQVGDDADLMKLRMRAPFCASAVSEARKLRVCASSLGDS